MNAFSIMRTLHIRLGCGRQSHKFDSSFSILNIYALRVEILEEIS